MNALGTKQCILVLESGRFSKAALALHCQEKWGSLLIDPWDSGLSTDPLLTHVAGKPPAPRHFNHHVSFHRIEPL